MRAKLLAAACLMGMAPMASAHTLDIYLSKETAQFNFITDSSAVGFGGADLFFGLFFNEDSDYMLTTGMHVRGVPAGEQPLTFGVGGKLYFGFIDEPDDKFQALGLGGEVRYTIPANTPMYFALEAYYAPPITSFGDADDLWDVSLRYELEVTPGAAGFIGYRRIETDLDYKKNYKLDDNIHFGIRFSF
ncbi:YfaZ family outer membrane protein [Ectothiorhodospira shaposhnikovii]|uniref:YfaZ family outer membrane protein n=1 Tax=Ectothiorhodospira shaposhnikovii TaxID=1054 RepID=UPI0039A0B108